MPQFLEYMKEHPYVTAGIALVGGVILYTAFFGGGSSSTGAPTQAQLDAANFATQTQGATDLAVAQAAQQAQQHANDVNAQVASDYINGQVSIAQLAANTALNAQQLQAGVQQSQIAGAVTLGQGQLADQVQIATLQQELGMAQNTTIGNLSQNALTASFGSPTGAAFSTPYINLVTHGTGTATASSPPPPPPSSSSGGGGGGYSTPTLLSPPSNTIAVADMPGGASSLFSPSGQSFADILGNWHGTTQDRVNLAASIAGPAGVADTFNQMYGALYTGGSGTGAVSDHGGN